MTEFIHFFPGEGFRPATFANDYIGPRMDCPLIVKVEDPVYLAKFDPYAPLQGYAWGTWLPDMAQEATGEPLAGANGVQATHSAKSAYLPSATIFPWPSYPPSPEYPCRCIEVPPIKPLDPAPVPVPASAGLLLLGLCILATLKRRKK